MMTLEDIDAHYARMDVPVETPVSRLPVDVMNPGTSRPENHPGRGLGLPSIDQTMSVSMASAAVKSSNGQGQRLDLSPLQGGVTVLEVPRVSERKYNGQFQSKNLRPVDQGTVASASKAHLPVTVSVANQNLHVPPLQTTVEMPRARDVRAGETRPGGVPISVQIR